MKIIEIWEPNRSYMDLLKKKQIHLVTVAGGGFSTASAYCSFGCNMKDSDKWNFIEQVNRRMEVGSLYPQCYLSLIPSFSYANRDEEIKNYIKDVLEIELKFIKSKHIVFELSASGLGDSENKKLYNLSKLVFDSYQNELKDTIIEFYMGV